MQEAHNKKQLIFLTLRTWHLKIFISLFATGVLVLKYKIWRTKQGLGGQAWTLQFLPWEPFPWAALRSFQKPQDSLQHGQRRGSEVDAPGSFVMTKPITFAKLFRKFPWMGWIVKFTPSDSGSRLLPVGVKTTHPRANPRAHHCRPMGRRSKKPFLTLVCFNKSL